MKIYDNGGKTWDRYTVIPNPKDTHISYIGAGPHVMTDCLGLSDNCDSPSGFGQWSECQLGKHLGKLVKLSDLPKNVQAHILSRLSI